MQVIKYMFQPHGDDRGQLVALEEAVQEFAGGALAVEHQDRAVFQFL